MPEKTEETPAEEAVELATYVVVGCTIDGVPEGDTIEMDVKKAAMHVRRGRLKLKSEVDDGDDGLRGDDRDGGDAVAVRREQHQRDDAGDDE